MKRKLSLKIIALTALAVVVGITAIGWILTYAFESEIRGSADKQASEQVDAVLSSLQMVDDLTLQAVQAAMKVLLREGEQMGMPEIRGSAQLGSASVPNLELGTSSQVGAFSLVDRVKQLTGSTSTLFIKKESDFVRVSTNVLKPDGSRAVGTKLDPQGRAYAAIRDGHSFYGVVDILGAPYMTGYEPMRNRSGEVIGVWYVGIPLTALAGLGQRISATRILDHGFVALLRADGRVIFKPQDVGEDEIHDKLQHVQTKQWTVLSKSFDRWGYTLLAAYPQSDITAKSGHMKMIIIDCILGASLFVVIAQYFFIIRFVVDPVRRLTTLMQDADLNTSLVEDRQDEIGILSQAFNQFVGRIREALLKVVQLSRDVAGASEKLESTSNGISENSEKTSAQAMVVSNAAQEVSQNLQTVATGAEQMGASIKEIAKNATEAAKVATSAVKVSETTTATVSKLGESSSEIGQVIKVITSIAQQTNLLALNATIEAARAGEAGKGFAVVANEVKELAKETAKATEDISRRIEAIQTDTKASVEAIATISGVINEINGISNTIATAVEEQNATTNEMSRNVTEAAKGSAQITSNIAGVATAAESASRGAGDTLNAAHQLVETSAELRRLVEQFKIGRQARSDLFAAGVSASTRAVYAG